MSEIENEQLRRLAEYWVGKVFCPYKAPELRLQLALEALEEIREVLKSVEKETK